MIENYNIYTAEMLKSLQDKIFFIDLVDVDVLVDYGCADGAVIKYLAVLYPHKQFIGYDIDDFMIVRASESCPPNCRFESSWTNTMALATKDKGTTALLLSSVLHEIYSYLPLDEIYDFWDNVYNNDFEYIIIRDMALAKEAYQGVGAALVEKLRKGGTYAQQSRLIQFENRWGSINQNPNFIHYLLKYRYVENWDREVQENYLPVTRDWIVRNNRGRGYGIMHNEHYVLPFLQRQIKADFNIELNTPTHVQLILDKHSD